METKPQTNNSQTKKTHQIEVRFKTQTLQKRKVKTWTPQQDQLLFQLHERFPKKWNQISQLMKNRNQNQCLHRYRRLVQVGDHKKIWSSEEDQTVLDMVNKYGNNWKFIAANLKTKTGKQIRERYINKLDPSIKRQEWSQTEDFKIIELYTKFGSRWSEISKGLPGRPENRIKNRFYSYIQKNYDILIKDQGVTHTNEMTPDQSNYNKSEMVEYKGFCTNFIYIPTMSEKRKESQSDEFLSQNKENKQKDHVYRGQKSQYERHYRRDSRKSIDEEWQQERSLQEINEPNQINYGSENNGNEDLLYFEED